MNRKNQVSEFRELIHRCDSRWLFARLSIELYKEALDRCPSPLAEVLQEIQSAKKEHLRVLEHVLRKYGSIPQGLAPTAQMIQRNSLSLQGLVQEESLEGIMDSLLTVELVDHVNWELLVLMTGKIGDAESKSLFEKAHQDCQRHLKIIRDHIFTETLDGLEGIMCRRSDAFHLDGDPAGRNVA